MKTKEMFSPKQVGERIKERRTELKLSMPELGKRIGVNKSNMMQYYYSLDAYPDAEIVFYDDIRGCLDGLLDGTSDGTFLNGLRTEALLKPVKYHSIKTERARNGFTFRMAFADDNIGLMLLMDRGLTMIDPDFVNKTTYSFVGKIYT